MVGGVTIESSISESPISNRPLRLRLSGAAPLSRGFHSVEMLLQHVEAVAQELPVAVQPLVYLGERRRSQAVDPALALAAPGNEAGLAQHPPVPRDGRAADCELRREVAGCPFALAQERQRPAASGVDDRFEDFHSGERNWIVTIVNVTTESAWTDAGYALALASVRWSFQYAEPSRSWAR
jgi:hypothetical protein